MPAPHDGKEASDRERYDRRLQGDQTGQELLDEALRVLEPFVRPLGIDFMTFDLSLENRRATQNKVVFDAAEAVIAHRFGLKAATITPGNPTTSAARTRCCVRQSTRR